jgi:aminoglycoside N3'-acetyltransferase
VKEFDGHEHRRPPESRLVEDFIKLGVQPGGVIMLHASFKAIGWVGGGAH